MSDVDGVADAAHRRGAAEVRARLDELPAPVAETLRLMYFGHLDHREIGARTGMTDSEVWTALRTGLLHLGRLLQGATTP